MIPRIANRGHSFKGAGAYYLHDKKASTNERVAWTYTHNLPTMDAEKGFKYMAYTAKNADYLKHKSQDVSSSGRKSTAGSVYSFSLSWHPEQDPHQSTMQNEALRVLAGLGLADHEAVIVAHNDEPHPHLHVVCNLVHPETGRTAVVSYDYLTTSKLAEELERKDGKIYCEQRVINNEKRRSQAKENGKMAFVKHKEKKLDMANRIQELYTSSDSGKAFQAAMQDAGYTLAQGDRRGIVLVNNDGEIFSLSRQLKGQRARDIKNRLANLENLPVAEQLSEDRKYFMRDQYETDRQKQIVDDAIKADEARNRNQNGENKSKGEKKPTAEKDVAKTEQVPVSSNSNNELMKPKVERSFAEELDRLRERDGNSVNRAIQRENDVRSFYKRETFIEQLKELEQQREQAKLGWSKQRIGQQIDDLKRTIANLDNRMIEQGIEPEGVADRNYNVSGNVKVTYDKIPEPEVTPEEQEIIEYLRKQREHSRDNDREPEI